MKPIAGIDPKSLRKTCVFFGLEDALVSGKIDSKVDLKAVKKILQNLLLLEKGIQGFRFFVASGYTQEQARMLVKKAGLNYVLAEDHCFFVTPEYLKAKETVDRELHEKALAEDPLFKDEFLAQRAIEQVSKEHGIPREKMVLIDHDLWFDSYYTSRFSKIDVVLIRSALSWRSEKQKQIVKGLSYINRTWPDIQKVLTGKLPLADNSQLNSMVQNFLGKELLGPQFLGAVLDAKKKKIENQ